MFIPRKVLEEKLIKLLIEDVGQGDVTSSAIVASECIAEAEVIAKDEGIVAGVDEATILAEVLGLKVDAKVEDKAEVTKGQVLLSLRGNAATILAVERTLLNLLSRMSGIATTTKNLTKELEKANLKTRLCSTRKSAPGLLYFDKKAVIAGGGDAHRLHLDDMILIKDNHIALAGSLDEALRLAKLNASFSKKIEVEVTNSADALKAAKLGADIVMLDNFSVEQISQVISLFKNTGYFGKVLMEASGGISSATFLKYAATEVDLISLGELTHSVKALDISLEIVKSS